MRTAVSGGIITPMAARYTDDQRAQALAIYAAQGTTAAAEATGIPKGTIASWANRNGVHTACNERTAAAVQAARLRWEERRLEMAHRIGETAELALHRVEQALGAPDADELRVIDTAFGREYDRIPTPTDTKALATTMAILVDKAQLLTGGATEVHEHVDQVDAEVSRLEAELALNDRAAA